jgi:23S rRNA (adenine2030-N6)-methyltransferase
MNYRHAFHAGNFADLLKHAVLLSLLQAMTRDAAPLQVLDTHAGAGVYDLGGEAALKSGEAQAGIIRLMAEPETPPVFDALKAQVRRLNPKGAVRLYPGSPVLAVQTLRKGDAYLGCELRPDDHALLAQTLAKQGLGRALLADGYEEAARPPAPGMRRPAI